MTFLRSSAAVGLAVALAAGAARAQQTTPDQSNRRPGAEMGERRGMRGMQPGAALLRGINLTAEQQQRIRAINEKYQAEGQQLRGAMRPRGDSGAARQGGRGNADQRQQFMALQERRVTEVRGVLTAEQQRQFDANRTEMQQRMQERRGERGGQGRRPDSAATHGAHGRAR